MALSRARVSGSEVEVSRRVCRVGFGEGREAEARERVGGFERGLLVVVLEEVCEEEQDESGVCVDGRDGLFGE